MARLIVLINVLVFASASQDPSWKRIAPRIIGGSDVVEIQSVPFQVEITAYPTMALTLKFCNGALLSNKFVITAASCFDDLALRHVVVLQFGAANLNNTNVSRIAKKKTLHTRYNRTTLENNLAIVEFQPVPLSEQIQPIRLPSLQQESNTFAGSSVVVSGRGENADEVPDQTPRRILRSGRTTVVTNDVCASSQAVPANVRINNICTTSDSSLPKLCSGDGGSPLYISQNGVSILIGIGSLENPVCGTQQRAAVFTRVTSYLDYISGVTSIPILQQ